MTFFDSIKRMFGFGPDSYYGTDPDTADDPDVATMYDGPATGTEPMAADDNAAMQPPQPKIDDAAKARIFAGVVEFINKSLPPFLQQSLNTEEQSRQIAQALDKDLDNYLAEVVKSAELYAEARLKGAADNARRDADKLRSDMESLEHQRSAMREKQLSAERRCRALTDRVSDLEGQVASLEAEREQFELENRSLMNKLKLADIQPGVVEELTKEVETLRAAAERQLADSRTQQDITQAMYDDLQKSLVDERHARQAAEAELAEARVVVESVTELEKQMQTVGNEIARRDNRIAKLKANNQHLREQIASLQAHLDEVARADMGLGLFAPDMQGNEDAAEKGNVTVLEDDFECPDWFVSEPAPGEVSPLLQPSPEFGYQEPPKKPRRPDSDAQLSLF